ncbi:hypothetical protein LJC28_03660 [Dysgonomonas sp. OttesenSCG-928-D17]|nr:hypothetical protein [Dysgonomonas sp. OttesenSCG-928-D17]
MKKYLLKVLLLSIIAAPFISCSDDDDEPWVEPEVNLTGAYILNSGMMKTVDGNLAYYDIDNKKVTTDIFSKMNDGLSLGDAVQDMKVYGSKMYITVTNSNKIYVTNRRAKLVKDGIISPENESKQPLRPRSIVTNNGKVYVSTEAGYVLRIDTTSMAMDKVKVGTFTEEMTIVGNKLYVTNSRVGSNIVSVLNLNNFTAQKKDIVVDDNPAVITRDAQGNVYVICWGDFNAATTTSSFNKIDSNDKVTQIATNAATLMAVDGDRILLILLDYINSIINFSYYDINTGKIEDKSFITDGTEVADVNSLTVDPVTRNIYIGINRNNSMGEMYIFSSEGKLISKFGTGGYYPMGAYFLTGIK